LQTRQNILQHKNRACKTPAENAGPTHPLKRTKAAGAAANSKKKEKPTPKDESPRNNAKPKRSNRWVLGLLGFKNTQREDDGFTREDGGSLRRNQFGGGGQEEARCETSSSSSSS